MVDCDVLVVGGGISGACFAFHAARAGRSVCVVEREQRAGGCLHTHRAESGFWYELAAHTCYNSYGGLLEVLEGRGLLDQLQARGKPVLRFLSGDRVVPGKNLGLLARLFKKTEFLRALPRWRGASQDGQSVRSYYSRLVGPGNYERVLGPMLSAVPSQPADDFPANMLFKKRERRKDVMRSFTLEHGLQSAVEGVLAEPGIEVTLGRRATRLERTDSGWAVTLDDGSRSECAVIALATPPGAAAELLGDAVPELAAQVARVNQARVDTLGFAVRASKVNTPYATFLIPLADTFYSIVTRDVVPDPEWRAFTFHFRPGQSTEARRERAAAVLHIRPEDMEEVTERSTVLPSPVLGHADVVADIDRQLDGRPLAVTGNWFGGLSIEDCALRSRSEWARVATLG